MRALTLAAVLTGAVAGLPSTAAAFHEAETFAAPALEGGGGRLSFTGSPRGGGYDCAICHTDASGAIRVAIASDPPELATERRYAPGQTYALTVALTGTHRGLGAPHDENGFALEVLDADGASAGTLAASSEDVVVQEGAALSRGTRPGATTWSVLWTAPPGGAVRLYVAGVDGDGGGAASTDGADPYGDDAWSGVLAADEAGPPVAAGAAPGGAGATAGACRQSQGQGGGAGGTWIAGLALLLALTRPRRNDHGRARPGCAMDRAREAGCAPASGVRPAAHRGGEPQGAAGCGG